MLVAIVVWYVLGVHNYPVKVICFKCLFPGVSTPQRTEKVFY